MYKVTFASVLLSAILLYSCQHKPADSKDKAKQEIKQAEKDFEKVASVKGIAEAFSYFGNSRAVYRSRITASCQQ